MLEKLLMKDSSSTVKNISLELGGNAPFAVFADANLDKAIEGFIAQNLEMLDKLVFLLIDYLLRIKFLISLLKNLS